MVVLTYVVGKPEFESAKTIQNIVLRPGQPFQIAPSLVFMKGNGKIHSGVKKKTYI